MRRIFSRRGPGRGIRPGSPESQQDQGLGVSVPLGIVADDLTGAGDTGGQFSRQAAAVLVLRSLSNLPRHLTGDWDVIAINTDSRNSPPDSARERVTQAMAYLARHDIPLVYKKIDSTLRGNLVPELEAVLARGVNRVYLAPAFPATGRTVEGGVLKVNGVPVADTPIGHDALSPVTESRLAQLLQPAFPEAMLAHWSPDSPPDPKLQSARIVVCDSASEADLEQLARELLPQLPGPLLMGSAGLARALAERLEFPPPAPHRHPRPRHGPVVIVSGSRSEVTARQGECLRQSMPCQQAIVEPGSVDGEWNAARAEGIVEQLVSDLGGPWGREVVLIRLGGDGGGESGGEAFAIRSQRLNDVVGALVRRLARHWAPRGLVLTGGDIAAAALEALDAVGIRLGEEVAPGIPSGTLVGGPAEGLPLVTKAGAFGEPEALLLATRHLLAAANRPPSNH